SSDIQLPSHSHRHRLPVHVQYVYARVRYRFANGGVPGPASGSLIVAHTVVSVGPYALIIRRPGPHLLTKAPEQNQLATVKVSTGKSPSPERVASTLGENAA